MNSADLRFDRSVFRTATVAALVAFAASCGDEGVTINTPECTPVDLAYPGSVNGTINSGTCQSGGFHAALFRFTADPDNSHEFTATSAFPGLGVEVMSDPPGSNVIWVSGSSGVSAEWLLPTGTYLLRLTARNGTGDFAVTGSTAPLNTSDCTVRTLVVSATLADHALATTDCPWLDGQGAPDGTYFDAYAIQSSKPCTIAMSSATMDAFIEIRNSTQSAVLGGNDDAPGGARPEDAFVSLAGCNNNGGPIVIRANTATSANATGAYTLAVVIEGGGSLVAGNRNVTPMEFGDTLSAFSPAELARAKLAKQQRR